MPGRSDDAEGAPRPDHSIPPAYTDEALPRSPPKDAGPRHQHGLGAPPKLAAAVLAAIPGPLLLADGAGTIRWANEHANRLFGYGPGELVGLCIDHLAERVEYHAEVRSRYMRAPSARVFGKGRLLQARHRDGTRFPVEVALQPLSVDGEPHVLALVRDVSERARLAEQLRRAQKMDALLTLGGALAHDFQNALSAIAGSVELLQERLRAGAPIAGGALSPDERIAALRELGTIERAAERGGALARSLLDLTRESDARLQRADLSALAAEAVPLITRLLGSRVRVRTRLAPTLPPALVQPGALNQALLNLAANARDALVEGGSLTIETRAIELDHAEIPADFEAPPGRFVELCVSDDGPGMSPEVLARATEPFFTTKPPGQGTGLGLAQVYATAQHAGGVLRIESAPGQGTTVRLALRPA